MAFALPDVKVTVKVDDGSLDRAAAKTEAFATVVDRKMQPAGQAFVKFGESGELMSARITSSTAKTRGDLDQLENRIKTWAAEAGKDFQAGTTAVLKLGSDGEAALAKLGTAAEGAAAPVETLATDVLSLGDTGPVAAAAVAALGLGVATAVAPVVGLAAGLAAVLGLGGLSIGTFGLLGGASVLLAQRVQGASEASQNAAAAETALEQATNAHAVAVSRLETLQRSLKGHRATADQLKLLQDLQEQVKGSAYDLVAAQNAVAAAGTRTLTPLEQLQQHAGKLADSLGRQATPAANMLYDWLGKLADRIAPVASQLIGWFSDRLPKVLPIVSKLVDDVLSQLQGFGQKLGPVIDDWIAHPEHFEKAFHDVVAQVIAATDGVIGKAQELANWWAAHHVELETDARVVFGTLASLTWDAINILHALILVVEEVKQSFDLATRVVGGAAAVIAANINSIGRAALTVEDDVGRLLLALSRLPGAGALTSIGASLAGSTADLGSGRRASGGPVLPGRLYTVGEAGPERLAMYPGGGGFVIPGSDSGGAGGPTNVTVVINGTQNPEAVAMAVDRRLSRLLLAT